MVWPLMFDVRPNHLPGPLARSAYDVFSQVPMPPSCIYIGLRRLHDETAASKLTTILPEVAASFLCWHVSAVVKLAREAGISGIDGAECWSGITGSGSRGARYLHVDNDEHARVLENDLRMPLLGSILYLGPRSGMQGGGTLFLTGEEPPPRLFRRHPWPRLLATRGARLVEPMPGTLVLFSGHIPHAVEPARMHIPHRPRVTLLVNLWARRIRSVPRGVLSASMARHRGLR